MDILEAKSEASWKDQEERNDELIRSWNERFAVGTIVRGVSYKLSDGPCPLEDIEFEGPTASKAYEYRLTAVVDVAGHTRVSLHRRFDSIGWDGSHRW